METSLYSWANSDRGRFDEDGPNARDRMHRAALRTTNQPSRRERTRSALQGLIARATPQRPAPSTNLECCATA